MRKVLCINHKKIKITIPDTVDECISLNSFLEIKSLEEHLEKFPNCKFIGVKK